ncbi:MAG: hypothetical protein IKL65_06105 [Bacilli bacterium]|nr:hypothetical protein [Bacilli bacterium]
MQMISPQTYREQNKDKSLNELIIKKEVLENDILNKEKILRNEITSMIPIEDIDTFVKVSRLYLEELNRLIKEKQNISSENNNEFQPINEKVEDLTKQLAEAYRKNDESLIKKLQEKIKNQTRKQLEKNADIFVKEEIKKQQEEIESKLDREKIKEHQKVIDDINKRIVANLVETWSMQTPEFKALRKELRIAISKMECYKNGIYDEDEIEQIYQDNIKKEKIILGKAYINRENLLDKIKYLTPGYDKRKEFSTINDFILAELKIIKEELLNTDGIEQSYIPCRRAKYCIEEFVKYINEDKFEESFYDIYEVIESDKYPHPLVDKGYEYSVYISNDEKSILLSMINKLESRIKNIENVYSSKNLYKKTIEEFNMFAGTEYGNSKFLSLPLPISYGKLKCLILISNTQHNSEVYNGGYVIIDKNNGKFEYKIEPETLLSNNIQLNLLNVVPKIDLIFNSKNDFDVKYNQYFDLLDDLIVLQASTIDDYAKKIVADYVNIYKNIEIEQCQIEQSLNNDFLSWCIILLHNSNDNLNKVETPQDYLTNISYKIFEIIKDLPSNSQFVFSQYFNNYTINEQDKFIICEKVLSLCSQYNIKILEQNPGQIMGLPWNIPRVKGE